MSLYIVLSHIYCSIIPLDSIYNYFSYLVKQISPVIRAVEEVALVCDKTEKPEGLHVSIFIAFNSMH